jgi:hypothetical protein
VLADVEHVLVVAGWVMDELSDVLIAVVGVGECLIQYLFQLLLFGFAFLQIMHTPDLLSQV